MSALSRTVATVLLFVPGLACHRRESLEDARARTAESALTREVADLQTLIAKAESGQLATQDRIAIGIAEDTTKALLDASLPQEKLLGDRVYVRLEAAQPFFRGNNASIVFRATARGKVTGAAAHLELGGRLVNYRLEKGNLAAGIELIHFKVLDSSLGDLGSDVLEALVQDNLKTLAQIAPVLEIPVHLEQTIEIGGLTEGLVVVKPGALPLEMTLAEVIPVGQRLWILLAVKAGPWRVAAPEGGRK